MKKHYIAICALSFLIILLVAVSFGPTVSPLSAAAVGISDDGSAAQDNAATPSLKTTTADTPESSPQTPSTPGGPAEGKKSSEEDAASPEVHFLEPDQAPVDVELSLNVRMDKAQYLYIDISTNLPDDTRIMLTVTDTLGSVYQKGRTLARVKAIVFDGTVTAGPFEVGDEPYPHGEYTVRVWTPALQLQPIPVQRAIGRRGGLTGPVVADGRVYVEKAVAVIGMDKW